MNKFEQYVERVRTEQLRSNIMPLRQTILGSPPYGSKQHKVAAYVDGSYYTNEKRNELKRIFADNPNVQICSLGDLYEN